MRQINGMNTIKVFPVWYSSGMNALWRSLERAYYLALSESRIFCLYDIWWQEWMGRVIGLGARDIMGIGWEFLNQGFSGYFHQDYVISFDGLNKKSSLRMHYFQNRIFEFFISCFFSQIYCFLKIYACLLSKTYLQFGNCTVSITSCIFRI